MDHLRPAEWRPSTRYLVVSAAWIVYAGLLVVVRPEQTVPLGSLVAVPVAVSGALLGRWGGLAAGLAAAPVNVAFGVAIGQGASGELLAGDVYGYVVVVGIGFFAGLTADSQVRLRRARDDQADLLGRFQEQSRLLSDAQREASIGDWHWYAREDLLVGSEVLWGLCGVPPRQAPKTMSEGMRLIHPDDQTRLRRELRLMDVQGPMSLELRIVTPDGRIRWMDVRMRVHKEDGAVTALSGTAQDVTERKNLEQTLETMVEHSPDGIARFDRALRCVHRNSAWESLVGGEADDVMSDERPWCRDLRARLKEATRSARHVEFTDDHEQDGIVRTLQTRIVPEMDERGEIATLLAVTRDVSGMRRQQQQLLEARDAMRVILDTAPLPIVQVDADGRVERVNDAFEQLFGFSRDELRGRIPPMVPPGGEEEYRASLHVTHATVARDVDRVTKDGTVIPVDIHSAPLPGGGFVRIDVDLRERKLLEEKDAEADKLREIDELKTQFLNTAAHELSTPLTPIKLQLSMMHDEDDPDPALDLLSRNVRRLEMLVKDLLDAARLQSGRLRFNPEVMDLGKVVEDVHQSLAAAADQAGVFLESSVEGELIVEADEHRVAQVLFNLVGNAIKFTPRGGQVTLAARRQADEVIIDVEDSGHGLTKRQIDQLFKPFTQFHREHVGTHVGTGLGLYICHGIMEAHGGSIEASSRGVGRGARFRLRFPAARPADPLPAPSRTQPAGRSSAAGRRDTA